MKKVLLFCFVYFIYINCNIIDSLLLSQDLVLCFNDSYAEVVFYYQGEQLPEFRTIEQCSTNKWISFFDCETCKLSSGTYCRNDITKKSYCTSKLSCEDDYLMYRRSNICPCDLFTGCNETIACENGFYDVFENKCICKDGFIGDKCDKCTSTSDTGRKYICCPFDKKKCINETCIISNDEIEWKLLAPSENALHKYLLGTFTKSSCFYNQGKMPYGIELNCDCSFKEKNFIESKRVIGFNNGEKENTLNIQSKVRKSIEIQSNEQLNFLNMVQGIPAEDIADYIQQVYEKKSSKSVINQAPLINQTQYNITGVILFTIVITLSVIITSIFAFQLIKTNYSKKKG